VKPFCQEAWRKVSRGHNTQGTTTEEVLEKWLASTSKTEYVNNDSAVRMYGMEGEALLRGREKNKKQKYYCNIFKNIT
jgi:hypothetical protein